MSTGGGATRLLAIRHGETDWNATARIQGHTDIALNATGRWQAECLARALAAEPLEAVYTSDLVRARDTAAPLARTTGAPLVHDAGLRERCFGRFEGATFDEIERRWPDDAARWRAREPDFTPGGGEPLAGFYARCVAAVDRLARAHRGGLIALVAHGGVLDCLYRAANGAGLRAKREWPLANASINRLLHTDEGLVLLGWNDVQHLGDGPPDPGPASR